MVGVVVGAAVVGAAGSAYASNQASGAAKDAANAQAQAAGQAASLQQSQFNRVQTLLAPYAQAGTGVFDAAGYLRANPDVASDPYFASRPEEHYRLHGQAEGRQGSYSGGALQAQQDILGLNGAGAQSASMQAIENSPYFSGLVKQGENALLQNASATGGLRGGNTAAALAQFRPNMLAAAIDQQYQRLGGMVNIGQNAAAGVGNAGQSMANNTGQLLSNQGAYQAGGILGQARANVQGVQGLASAFGTAAPVIAGYMNQPSGITGTSGGNAGAYSTGATLNNNFGGSPVYF